MTEHTALQHTPADAATSPDTAHLAATILSGDVSLDAAISLTAAHFLARSRADAVVATLTNFTPEDESGWRRLGARAWVREWLPAGASRSILPAPDAGPEAALTMPWLSPRARTGIIALVDGELLPDEARQDRIELNRVGARSLVAATYTTDGDMFGSFSVASAVPGPWPDSLIADLRLLNAAITTRLALAQARRALAEAIAVADEARVTHQQFFASIGHELRTPLAAVLGYTEVLMGEAELDTPEPIAAVLRSDGQRILRACEQLVSVVDNLLGAGRTLASGDTREDVVVAEAIADVAHWHGTPARTAQVSIESSVDPSVTVWAHPSGVRQVLSNLLSNAILHNHRGGSVHVSAASLLGESGRDMVRIVVRDDGPGLTAEQMEHAFEPFVRFAVEPKGSGLGLPLCRTIAERDGGSVRGESTPGEGSAFWLELPASRPRGS